MKHKTRWSALIGVAVAVAIPNMRFFFSATDSGFESQIVSNCKGDALCERVAREHAKECFKKSMLFQTVEQCVLKEVTRARVFDMCDEEECRQAVKSGFAGCFADRPFGSYEYSESYLDRLADCVGM